MVDWYRYCTDLKQKAELQQLYHAKIENKI
jgi:hypothetical protein